MGFRRPPVRIPPSRPDLTTASVSTCECWRSSRLGARPRHFAVWPRTVQLGATARLSPTLPPRFLPSTFALRGHGLRLRGRGVATLLLLLEPRMGDLEGGFHELAYCLRRRYRFGPVAKRESILGR